MMLVLLPNAVCNVVNLAIDGFLLTALIAKHNYSLRPNNNLAIHGFLLTALIAKHNYLLRPNNNLAIHGFLLTALIAKHNYSLRPNNKVNYTAFYSYNKERLQLFIIFLYML